MSSLWTPGGEHRVPREPSAEPAAPTDHGGAPYDDDDRDLDAGPIDEEAQAALRAELDAARHRVAGVPAAQVVANHAMGLFELAAIHLGSEPPHLTDAALAIDALGALLDGVGDRLGEPAAALRAALAQLRLAFVQVKDAAASH